MRRPHGGHVLGASPQVPFADDLSARQGDLICPQDQLLDLRMIQSWYQSGALKGGLWLPDWAYLAQDSARTAITASGQVVGSLKDATRDGLLGPELFVNNPLPTIFNAGSTSGSYDSVTRTLTATGDSVNDGYPRFFFLSSPLGKTYNISLTLSGDVSWMYIACYFGRQVVVPMGYTTGTVTVTSTYADGLYIPFRRTVNAGDVKTITIVDVSIREVLGNHATQTTTANKPLTAITPVTGKPWLNADSTDVLPVVFPTSLGSACTIARATPTGVTFDENQLISTTWNDLIRPYQYNSAVLVADRQLTAREKAIVSRVLGAYVPGLGKDAEANPALDADSGWTKGTGWSIGSGVATKAAGTASNLSQDVARTGIPYHVTADITRTAGTIGAANGTTQQGSVSASGALTQTIVATGTTIGVRGDSSFAGTADNVRVREIA